MNTSIPTSHIRKVKEFNNPKVPADTVYAVDTTSSPLANTFICHSSGTCNAQIFCYVGTGESDSQATYTSSEIDASGRSVDLP